MAYLYRHIRLDKNVPFYIGVGNDVDGSYKRANTLFNRNIFWERIISKTKYEVEIILDNLLESEAYEKEVEFIKLYGRRDIGVGSLCNLTDGGEGRRNVIVSDETRAKISKSNRGRPASKKAVAKLIEFNKTRKGSKWSAERVENFICNRRVFQYNLNGEFINEFNSISDAAKYIKKKASMVHIVCTGNRKSAGGYMWRYVSGNDGNDIFPRRSKIDKRVVLQYTLNGDFVKEYESVSFAAKCIIGNCAGLQEACSAVSRTYKGYMWIYSEGEIKEKIPSLVIGKTTIRPILQFDIIGTFIREYNSINEAAKEVSGYVTDIANVCKGVAKSSKGYIWRYKNI